MKAIFLVKNGTSASAFELRETPTPTPKANEVRIKVEAFGLNYADVMAREGMYEDCPPLPTVIGYDVVGHIDALGSDVTEFKIGQRVAALTRFGAYAEYAVTMADGVVAIPDHMPAGVATALATQYSTAYFCAEDQTRLHPGDHVLVQAAAGGVGTALVQLAKRRGCIVYGTAGSKEKLDYLRRQGVDFPINYREEDFEAVIKKQRGDAGLDVIFDSLGGSSVKKGRRLLGAGGRMICYGAAELSGGKNIFKILKFAAAFGISSPIPLLQNSRGIIGVNMLRIADNRPKTLARVMRAVADLVIKGELHPEVGGEFSYTDIAKAHDFLASRKSTGKIIVKW